MGKANKKVQIILFILSIYFCLATNANAQAGENILFVTAVMNETNVMADDERIIQQLTQAGFEVTLQSQDNCTADDADGMDLVFISERVSASKVAAVYKEVEVPVIVCEPFIFDDMDMASDVGFERDQSQLDIVSSGSALAAGLSGTVDICNSGETVALNYGTPAADATVVATVYGNSSRAVFFVYEKDETMEDGFIAPAKRAAFFMFKEAALSLNADGWKLFDALMDWCFSRGKVQFNSHPKFALYSPDNAAYFTVPLENNTSRQISVTKFILSNNSFRSTIALPFSVAAGASKQIGINVTGSGTDLYRSQCTVGYVSGGQTKTHRCELVFGLFESDDSETAHIARKAVDAYNACISDDSSSVNTLNNMGVLYRLLGEYSIARDTLASATNKAINQKYGYAGIKMNYGVIGSDRNYSTTANNYYDLALTDISSNETGSALAPQIYYNQAWEDYRQDKFSDALSLLEQVFSHSKSTDYVKAKAYVLRGAIYFRQGFTFSADNAFQTAITYDPDGPIGRMAQENINAITSVEDEDGDQNIPRVFTLMPNYPNPFNPSTTVSFALPDPCKVEIAIYNVTGQKIRTVLSQSMERGWHHASWDGKTDSGSDVGSGVYILQLRSANFRASNKITLIR